MSTRPITRIDTLPDHRIEDAMEEYKKCKDNPYYFATKYVHVNGEPFRTRLSETQFNLIAQAIGRSCREIMSIPTGIGKARL